MLDLIVRGGMLVRPEGLLRADLGVAEGVIATVAPVVNETAQAEIDATGLHIFPGVVDVHVHFNEPGRTEWEGFATGSRALAAGGGTLCVDMPLNSSPPVVDEASFLAKRQAVAASSVVDYALWGGLVPGHVADLPALAEAGAAGFKAFMSDSGLAEFPPADAATLQAGMRVAAAYGLPVAVHAESETLVRQLTQEIRAAGGRAVAEYLASRPVAAELEAVRQALDLAGETGARLHVVHVSSGAAVALIAQAKAAGVDVSLETCPHYLVFTADDVAQVGAALKCAPPIRGAEERQAIWAALRSGQIDLVASDHSPAPAEMKQGDDFFAIWGGIAGVQSTLAALLSEGPPWGVGPDAVARLVSETPALRFALPGKGRLAEGFDADFTLVDLADPWVLQAEDLHQRHPISPYIGRRFQARIRQTVVRGRTVFADGTAIGEAWGRFVRPAPLGPHAAGGSL